VGAAIRASVYVVLGLGALVDVIPAMIADPTPGPLRPSPTRRAHEADAAVA